MRPTILAALLALCGGMAQAEMVIRDAYARSNGPNAMAGAAFLVIENSGPEDDRLVAIRSDAAARVELHAHQDNGQGVMRMVHLEDGIAIPAGETHALERGGDHVMFLGLTRRFEEGTTVTVTFIFEMAGEVVAAIPVDLTR